MVNKQAVKEDRIKLGQLLIQSKKIDKSKLDQALEFKKEKNGYLGKSLVTLNILSEEEVIQAVSEQLRIPWIDPLTYKIKTETLKLINEETAKRLNVIPLFRFDNSLTIACADQHNVNIIDELTEQTKMDINLVLATDRNIEQALILHYKLQSYKSTKSDGNEVVVAQDNAALISTVSSEEIASDTEAIKVLNMLMDGAIQMGASDIHIDPREKDVRIRFRIDGVMQQYYTIAVKTLPSIISRIKILAGMDIAESRRHQDGRFRHEINKNIVDVRCATYPTPLGEKTVMRILDSSRGQIAFSKLGFSDDMLTQWDKIISSSNGLVLVTGPTGSGKTTTLYSTLNVINTVEKNILTIEDPIEYQVDNINQSQINEKAGVTFSASLRAMLRLDPDIIMVGEMRDRETIELAIRAALTGHIVFSTLHTNNAASTYTRILNMGVDAYLVSSTLSAILAQRLVRRLCLKCKRAIKPTTAMTKYLQIEKGFKGEIFEPIGCADCRNNGYAGRAAVYEMLIPNEEISDLVNKNATAHDIEKAAIRNGMVTLNESGRQLVLEGVTSIDEISRVSLG